MDMDRAMAIVIDLAKRGMIDEAGESAVIRQVEEFMRRVIDRPWPPSSRIEPPEEVKVTEADPDEAGRLGLPDGTQLLECRVTTDSLDLAVYAPGQIFVRIPGCADTFRYEHKPASVQWTRIEEDA